MRPKNITMSLYTLRYVVKVAFYPSASFIHILLYSHLRSIFVNTFFVFIVLIKSEINGNRQLSLTVPLFRYQQSYTILFFLFFFPTKNTGEVWSNFEGLIYPFLNCSSTNSLTFFIFSLNIKYVFFFSLVQNLLSDLLYGPKVFSLAFFPILLF